MAIDFDVTENKQDKRPDKTPIPDMKLVKVNFRPVPGEPVHSNIFHMQLWPTGTRLLVDREGRLVTESGKLIVPDALGLFPDENSADPYQRENYTRNNDAEMVVNIEAYWERKLKAAAEGKPYPRHHRSTVNLQVAASTDDCQVVDNNPPDAVLDSINVTTTFPSMGRSAGGAAFGESTRFTSVAIGQADTIDAASLVWTPRATLSGTVVNSNIDGEDADDAATFSTIGDYNARARTTALVVFDSIGTWTDDVEVTSGELKTIIKEIVDRGSWASGNALVLFWENDVSDINALRAPHSYDADTAKATKLDIDFTEAAEEEAAAAASAVMGPVVQHTPATAVAY